MHLAIEIQSVSDFQDVPDVIDHACTINFTKGFKARLVSFKRLQPLDAYVHVVCHFLDNYLCFKPRIRCQIVKETNWNAV